MHNHRQLYTDLHTPPAPGNGAILAGAALTAVAVWLIVAFLFSI